MVVTITFRLGTFCETLGKFLRKASPSPWSGQAHQPSVLAIIFDGQYDGPSKHIERKRD